MITDPRIRMRVGRCGSYTGGPASACTNASASGITTVAACVATKVDADGVAPNGCEACSSGYSGPTCQLGGCPAGATAGGKYCSDLVGQCWGPGGSGDVVNAKYKYSVASRADCQAGCDAAPACVGYAYQASYAACVVHGPGLDTDLGGGWTAFTAPATTIASADGTSGILCAAVAGRN
jgi:hypothetical protein